MRSRKWHSSEDMLDRLEAALDACKDSEHIMMLQSLGKIIEDDKQRAEEAARPIRWWNAAALGMAAASLTLSSSQLSGVLLDLTYLIAGMAMALAIYIVIRPVLTEQGRDAIRARLSKARYLSWLTPRLNKDAYWSRIQILVAACLTFLVSGLLLLAGRISHMSELELSIILIVMGFIFVLLAVITPRPK